MSFNRTKDKATLSFLQVSKYWDSSFDRESLLPWTWLANMEVSHLQTQPLSFKPDPVSPDSPRTLSLIYGPVHIQPPWVTCQHGCLCLVVPVLHVCFPRSPYNWLLTAHRPFSSRSAFITPVILYHQTSQNGLLALNIEEYITCLYILNCLLFCLHETLHPVSSSSSLHPQSLDQCLWDCSHSINILLKTVILIF